MEINQNLLKDLQRKGMKNGSIKDLVRKSQTIDRSMLRKRNINVRKSTAKRQLLDPFQENPSTEKNIRIRTVR